ncbi:MAG: hypothetical protein RLZZ214_2479 [Verrucomicrobiota bacterium]|jgi:hypothetical protein
MVRGSDSLELIPREIDGAVIPQRSKDGYVNATAMFEAAGKSVVDYTRLNDNKEFMNELEGSVRILTDPLVISTTTGPNELRGTWIHPDMAANPSHLCHHQLRRRRELAHCRDRIRWESILCRLLSKFGKQKMRRAQRRNGATRTTGYPGPPRRIPPSALPPHEGLIPLDISYPQEPRVNARDLHEFLEIGRVFGVGIAERVEGIEFFKDQDFGAFQELRKNPKGGRPRKEYLLSMGKAKELLSGATLIASGDHHPARVHRGIRLQGQHGAHGRVSTAARSDLPRNRRGGDSATLCGWLRERHGDVQSCG